MIHFLVSESEKKPHLLEEACKPLPEAEEALRELYLERVLDEKRLQRKVGVRRKGIN